MHTVHHWFNQLISWQEWDFTQFLYRLALIHPVVGGVDVKQWHIGRGRWRYIKSEVYGIGTAERCIVSQSLEGNYCVLQKHIQVISTFIGYSSVVELKISWNWQTGKISCILITPQSLQCLISCSIVKTSSWIRKTISSSPESSRSSPDGSSVCSTTSWVRCLQWSCHAWKEPAAHKRPFRSVLNVAASHVT